MLEPRTCLIAILALCPTLTGCAQLDLKLAQFISADQAPANARLPAGYEVKNVVLAQEKHSIGITYAHHPKSRAVILFFGGNVFHRSVEGGEVLEALALDADVALFDYPGHGDTDGTVSADSLLDTAAAVYDYIFNLDAARGKTRVLYGFSLGGMVAAQLAQDRPAAALVLEATAPNATRWAQTRIPWALRPFTRISVEPQLAALDLPRALEHFPGRLLLLTSRADRTVPAPLSFEMERQLRQAGRDVALVEFPGRTHGSIHRSPTFPATLKNFLERLSALQ